MFSLSNKLFSRQTMIYAKRCIKLQVYTKFTFFVCTKFSLFIWQLSNLFIVRRNFPFKAFMNRKDTDEGEKGRMKPMKSDLNGFIILPSSFRALQRAAHNKGISTKKKSTKQKSHIGLMSTSKWQFSENQRFSQDNRIWFQSEMDTHTHEHTKNIWNWNKMNLWMH